VNVEVSEDWESFLRSKVQSGRYASQGEVVEESLRLLRQRDQEREIDPGPNEAEGVKTAEGPSARKPIWEVFEEIAASIPEAEWDKLPVDGAEQHDHYIYGTPKRPTS
jgi:Arc/MetJ-type ribon-helix-helix transcriptional regulator